MALSEAVHGRYNEGTFYHLESTTEGYMEMGYTNSRTKTYSQLDGE